MTRLRRSLSLALLAGASMVVVVLAAGCSSSSSECSVSFSGNFEETSASMADCASFMAGTTTGDELLTFAIPSAELGATLMVSIDLGPSPQAGTYSSETASTWSALVAMGSGDGDCEYAAGTGITPGGSFTLDLTSVDAAHQTAHGTLDIVQYVQAAAATDCGPGDNENVDITF